MATNNQQDNFDKDSFSSCVNRAMGLINARKNQMIDEGYDFNINVDSCRWRIEQEIINRKSYETMMEAAIRIVEMVEHQAEEFNGLV